MALYFGRQKVYATVGTPMNGGSSAPGAGGAESKWVPYISGGVIWNGETVADYSEHDNYDDVVISPTDQYRFTIDGVSQVIESRAVSSNNDFIDFEGGSLYGEFGCVCLEFYDGESHSVKIESWTGEEPYVEGSEV